MAACGVALALAVVAWLVQGAARGVEGISPDRRGGQIRRPLPRAEATAPERATPGGRNVFEFQDAPTASGAAIAPRPRAVASPPMVPPALALPEPAQVLLVGIVVRGGQRKAALRLLGELAVLAPGESAEGYTVMSIDEEEGVRLRGPEGEITLPAPRG